MFQWGALPRGLWACSEADLGDMPQRGCWREAQSEMQEMRKIPVGDDGRYQRCASFIMFIWLVHLEIKISNLGRFDLVLPLMLICVAAPQQRLGESCFEWHHSISESPPLRK